MHLAVCLVLAVVATIVGAYPFGAPVMVCESMAPGHRFDPQGSDSPFVTEPEKNNVDVNTSVKLILRAREPGHTFKGFLLTAVDKETGKVIGSFSFASDSELGRAKSCDGLTQNMATHQENSPKSLVEVTWTPPKDFEGTVIFRTTFVQSFQVYWVKVESVPVQVAKQPSNVIPDLADIARVLNVTKNLPREMLSPERQEEIRKNITAIISKVPANRPNWQSSSWGLLDFQRMFRNFVKWIFS